MPMYEYKCVECGDVFAEFRDMKDRNEPATCPQCGSCAMRTLSIPAILIKSTYSESFPEVDANAPEWEEYPAESRP